MSKSYWMEKQEGNFSREGKDTFDPEKRYVGIRLQQGVPLLDRDWNELEDIRRYEELMLRKWYVGNGTPDDGFKISAADPPANDFRIAAGRCIVDGFEAVNEPEDEGAYLFSMDNVELEEDLNKGIVSEKLKEAFKEEGFPLSYNVNIRKRKENEWVIANTEKFIVKKEGEELKVYEVAKYVLGEALNPPSEGIREDTVYLDVWIEERKSGKGEYDAPDNSEDVNVETCVRHKLEWRVRVDEGSKRTEEDKKEYHHYYDLARITRKPETTILDEDIVDLRTTSLALDIIQNRLKKVINTILKGNLPSDPEVQLATLPGNVKGYPPSFEDTQGNIWLFWCDDKNICCKRYSDNEWGEKTTLTTGDTSKRYPNVFEDTQGNIWLFWIEFRGKIVKYIWYRRYNASTGKWGDVKPVTKSGSYKKYLNVFEDAQGNIWLFWDAGNGNICCSRYSGNKWEVEISLTTGATYKTYLNVFEDAQGNIWLFWDADRNICCKRYNASTREWGEETILTTGETSKDYLNAFEDAQGNIWLFWDADGICYKSYNGEIWSEEKQLTDKYTKYRNAFEDAQGNIWLFWSRSSHILFKRYRYNVWENKETQLTSGEVDIYLNVFEDAQGNIWLFWRSMYPSYFWCKSYRNGLWSEETQITTGETSKYYNVFEDHEGRIWLLFRASGSDNIWCKRYVDGDWVAEMRLNSGTTDKSYLNYFEDHEGNIWLFWSVRQPTEDSYSIWCKKCYASI